MKTVNHFCTLFHYDGAQIFEARDRIGGHYIAVMVPPDGLDDRHLVVGTEPEQLRQFRSGDIDLRELILASDENERFLAITTRLDEPLTLEHLSVPLEESEYLPDSSFVLHDSPANNDVVREARRRNNLVLEISIDPPEAAMEHRVRIYTIAEMLTRVQVMVKRAYRSGIKERPVDSPQQSDDYLMDVVVPAAAGSFRMVLEAANLPSLFGKHNLESAFRQIDMLFENTAEPDETILTIQQAGGHLAGAYLKLLRFLSEKKTGLQYSWADPNSRVSHDRSISKAETKALVHALSRVKDLGSEQIVLEGEFDKVDRGLGSWGLVTEEGKRVGKIRDGGPSLNGLRVGARYRFHCDEDIEVDITGREARNLFLNRHEPI